ncbi:MAG: hypothetical protein JSV81_03145 [Anaerolineales bacterium]|nr:MAG: hypothetical protein JSV81_03145 [Anaerolineales bacterium]
MAGNNRLFVLIALFLVGLLVLGLLAIGGVVIVGSINRSQQAARPTSTPTLPAIAQATATRLPTATLPPTNTLEPTLTPTKVVQDTPTLTGDETATPEPAERATSTPVPGATPAGEGTTPDTGIGGLGAALAAVGLGSVLFIVRRLRTAS